MYKELIADPAEFARRVRVDVARINCRTRDSHIGGGYSAVDVMAVLYTRILKLNRHNLADPDRNVFILSKGHIATTMFAVLAHAGIIPYEDLEKHLLNGENYAGHTRRYTVPGIEMSAGSLGHGSCVGCGMAYAKRIQGYRGNVYVLMGDGECNEGSVWESAMFAARFKLSNLVFIVDRNHLQAYGRDEQVLDMGNLEEKFRSFGCHAVTVNGHDYIQIQQALEKGVSDMPGAPAVIIADTVKGKGVSFMEDRLEWHFKSPNEEQLKTALEELGE
ncbi:MAG: transketolase [Lachnospiraceae bacterium]|nr:transketolase [Lachnospiraceae bacterium]